MARKFKVNDKARVVWLPPIPEAKLYLNKEVVIRDIMPDKQFGYYYVVEALDGTTIQGRSKTAMLEDWLEPIKKDGLEAGSWEEVKRITKGWSPINEKEKA